MSRIQETFARLKAEGRTAIMPYLMLGFPERESVLELAPALEAAGADMFEFGFPFSDPLADGATVQRASERALANGVQLRDYFTAIRTLRQNGLKAPIVPMGYYNPFLQYGIERFAKDAADAGADGMIIPDLPPEEAAECQAACQAAGLDLICFVAPTTPDERIAEIVKIASGFLYCVALTGVTGARRDLWEGLPDFLKRVRKQTELPLVVGFGISTAHHVRQVSEYAEGAIVASALINIIEGLPTHEQAPAAAAFVRGLQE